MNLDLIRAQITDAEKALSAAGGEVCQQINVRYQLGKPAPSALWASEALKALGLVANDYLIFWHRVEGYSGLLVTTVPDHPLPEPWTPIDYPLMNGGTDLHWYHDDLNAQYQKWLATR